MKYQVLFFCTAALSFSSCKKEPTDSTETCPRPAEIFLNDNSGGLNIQISGTNDFYEIEYGSNGFSRGSGTTVTSNSGYTAYLTNGAYDFYARGNCGGSEWSQWYGPKSILVQNGTPPVTCFAPDNLYINSPLNGVYWNASNAGVYQVEYGVSGFAHGQGTTGIANSTNFTNMSLAVGNTYAFYVRGVCASGDTSQWAGPVLYYAASNWRMCLPPISLTATRSGCCTLETSFDGNGESSYETAINTYASPTGGTTFFTTYTTNSYSLGSSSTRYFYVRSICEDGSKTAWAGPIVVN